MSNINFFENLWNKVKYCLFKFINNNLYLSVI